MKSTTYDFLKDLTMLYLPAAATLYVAIAGIWNLPYATEVAGTVAAVCTFLGTCLKISKSNYVKAEATAEIEASEDIGGETHREKPESEA